MFSATFEDSVKLLTRKFLNEDHYYITNNEGSGLKVNENVKQEFFDISDEYEKYDKLLELLENDIKGSVLSKLINLIPINHIT